MVRMGKRQWIRQRIKNNPAANPRKLASCEGKIRYEKKDRQQALENRPSNIHFYKCDFCRYYHIGRKSNGQK